MKSLLAMVFEAGIPSKIDKKRWMLGIMTLKSYLQYFKKMPKSGTEFNL